MEVQGKNNSITVKIFFCAILMAVFLGQYLLSRFVLGELYLFEWQVHQRFCYLWIFIPLFVFLNMEIAALTLTAGNVLGSAAGHFLGTLLYQDNLKQITPNMKPETLYALTSRKDVYIWLGVVLCSLGAGLWIKFKQGRKQ